MPIKPNFELVRKQLEKLTHAQLLNKTMQLTHDLYGAREALRAIEHTAHTELV